ncbi:MAG: thioredoxin family protein [Bdellovibrionales bacterium]
MNAKFIYLCLVFFISTTTALGSQISWHKGPVEDALKMAKTQKKPMILYWGASWCPPCEALKLNVFPNPEFIEATKNFVMIYLDGDNKDAQIWGEKFGATGYPSLIVLNENAVELQRLNSLMSAPELAKELLQAQQNSQNMDELLENILQEKTLDKISPQSWTRLAKYRWENHPQWESRKEEFIAKFKLIVEKIPSHFANEKNFFDFIILRYRLATLKPGEKLDSLVLDAGLELVNKIILDKKMTLTFFEDITFGAETFPRGFFPDPSENRIELIRFIMNYRKALWELYKHKDLTLQQRGYVLAGISELSSFHHPEYPVLTSDEQKRLKDELLQTLNKSKSSQERVVVFNILPYIFKKLGKSDEARQLILKFQDKLGSKNLVYTQLANLDIDEGRLESALKWSEKAHATATGAATRSQWGQSYAQLLIEVSPKNHKQIWKVSQEIIDEGLSVKDGLSGRSARSLNRLKKNLISWSAKEKTPTPEKFIEIKDKKCLGETEFVRKCEEYFKGLL